MSSENSQADLNREISEARKKFGELYGNLKLGGKGTQKRKKLVTHKSSAQQDKKISNLAKKSQAKKLNDIQEVNIFNNDNTVIHFKKPNYEYSMKEKVSFVTGSHELKHIKDLLPNIIKQLGPRQFSFMQEYAETLKNNKNEAPELVEDFEMASEK